MPDHPTGVVLAAGEGRRYGMPKALVRGDDGRSWGERAVEALVEGGCGDVVVVLGALAEAALHLVPAGAGVVVARDWAAGPQASLAAGLAAVTSPVAVVTLVDLPRLRPEAVARVASGADEATVARAAYAGAPGHPVVVGRRHFAAFAGTRRPGSVLERLRALEVDCSDLGGGEDVDVPQGLRVIR